MNSKLCALALVLPSIGAAELTGTLSVDSALSHDGFSKQEIRIEPRWDHTPLPSVWVTVKGRVRIDLYDQLDEGRVNNDTRSTQSRRFGIGNHIDAELREVYADFALGQTQFRVGKQQVVWGQADGLRVLDMVNPLSYREFILGDFEDRRIPLWMVNAEVPVGSVVLQGLFIPDQTYDEYPSPGSEFRFDAIRSMDIEYNKPSRTLADADFGLKVSAFTRGWDWSVNYLRHFRDEARLGFVDGHLVGEYYRSHLVGASGSKAFGDGVIRLELGYDSDYWDTKTQALESRTSAVVGYDYSGFSETFISVQFFVSELDDHSTERASVLASRDLLNDRFKIEVLALHDLGDDDGVIQLDLSYEANSNLLVKLGSDSFYGSDTGDFGQFDSRDRIRLGLEYSF